jgi:hypothetical protein
LAAIPDQKLGNELYMSSALWARSWDNASSLDDDSKRYILEVMARIPGEPGN